LKAPGFISHPPRPLLGGLSGSVAKPPFSMCSVTRMLSLIARYKFRNKDSKVSPLTASAAPASKLIERNADDSEAEVRRIPTIFAQEEPKNRPPSQPRHFQYQASRRSSRACRAIFQAALRSFGLVDLRRTLRSNRRKDSVATHIRTAATTTIG
jgi:hypothetical protein